MGMCSTVVINHDALDLIEKDPGFGKTLGRVIRSMPGNGVPGEHQRADVPAGNHGNAASVVESHDTAYTTVVTVGGGIGVRHALRFGYDHHTPEGAARMLRAWAEQLGFDLVPRKKG